MKASATKNCHALFLISLCRLVWRCSLSVLQVTWQIATGKLDRLIAGHEAEEELEALKKK